MAHDFNNMLAVILILAEQELTGLDDAQPLRASLQEIHKAASRSAELTRQLLAFARQQPVAPVRLDLNAAVEAMLKMLERLLGKSVALQWRPAADLWPVRMDPSQVDQVLMNLCLNARDAIVGRGSLALSSANVELGADFVAQHLGSQLGRHVLLTVTDDGQGMTEPTRRRAFEPFFTTKAQGQGTGLGLATVYGIVKQNHGYIEVESSPERGSTFRVYLPRLAEPGA